MLEGEQLGDTDRPGAADARQIVAHQVNDHQVLGTVLRALRERLSEQAVVLRTEPARHRSLDWARLDVPELIDSEEALGRGADDADVRRFKESRKRRSVTDAHPPVQVPG